MGLVMAAQVPGSAVLGLVFAGVSLACLIVLMTGRRHGGFGSYYPASPEDLALCEDLVEPFWLVEIGIFKDGQRQGWDHGVVGFADGAMFFAGEGCSFTVGPQDLVAPKVWSIPALLHERLTSPLNGKHDSTWIARGGGDTSWQPCLVVRLRHARDVRLRLYVLWRSGRSARLDQAALLEALNLFAAGAPYEGHRSYPPLSRPPEALVQAG